MLPASSRYGRLLLSSSPFTAPPVSPLNSDWYIPGQISDSFRGSDVDPTPAEFEPVPAPNSFKIPTDADGNPKDASDISEAEIYSSDDSRATIGLKQSEFWEWEHECTLRKRRWKKRFGNPHTLLGQLQITLESSIKTSNDERASGELPEWIEDSWLAQLIVFYPPVLERLVEFLDLQTLLGLMGSSVFLGRWLLDYPPAWRHISFDVRKAGFQKECEDAINEDAQHGSKHGAWTGSRLRYPSGVMILECVLGSMGSIMTFGEARTLSSLPLAGLRYLDLDGSPAAGGIAFKDILEITRDTLEVLSVRFCRFVGVADVERLLVSCAVKHEEVEEEEEEEDEDEEDIYGQEDNGTGYHFVKLSSCALRKLQIWGIQGDAHHRISTSRKIAPPTEFNRGYTTRKTALPIEINRSYMTRKTKSGAAVDVDQRGSFTNGMFYIPNNIKRKATEGYWDNSNPASQDITGRMLAIARQLGIETDFEDCDASGDCWNHKHIRTSSEWKVGVPGLRTLRKCSRCQSKKKGTMCRDCEEHRTCFGCKKMVCRYCDPEFLFVGNQCDPCSDEGRLYCRDCRDATTEALSELAAAESSREGHVRMVSCPGGLGCTEAVCSK